MVLAQVLKLGIHHSAKDELSYATYMKLKKYVEGQNNGATLRHPCVILDSIDENVIRKACSKVVMDEVYRGLIDDGVKPYHLEYSASIRYTETGLIFLDQLHLQNRLGMMRVSL